MLKLNVLYWPLKEWSGNEENIIDEVLLLNDVARGSMKSIGSLLVWILGGIMIDGAEISYY